MPFAVEARGLGKAYRVYSRPTDRVLESVSLGRWRRHREHWAIRGVDLAIPRGGALGICGANGAGKSTLLKILAGTTTPTNGRFRVDGSTSLYYAVRSMQGFQSQNTKSQVVSHGTATTANPMTLTPT